MDTILKVCMHCMNVKRDTKGTIEVRVMEMELGVQLRHVLVIRSILYYFTDSGLESHYILLKKC